MKSVTVARNYAEALFAAGDRFGPVLDAVAGAVQADEHIAAVLESPRVSKTAKAQILERASQFDISRNVARTLEILVQSAASAVSTSGKIRKT